MTTSGAPTDRFVQWLLHELPRAAPAWLPRQRWFGGKARTIVGVNTEDVFRIDVDRRIVVVIVSVRYADETPDGGIPERYALALGFNSDHDGHTAIGHIAGPPSRTAVIDATADPQAWRALVGTLAAGSRIQGIRGGWLESADTSEMAAAMSRDDALGAMAISHVGLEQSNTSVRVGSAFVFKLFRRLERGENPQLEIGRFLSSRTRFRAAPSLGGSITYHDSHGDPATLGILEGWIASRGDGWSYVLSELEAAATHGTGLDRLADDMRRLATITAEFHAAMASDQQLDAFAPESVTPDDVAAWRANAIARADGALRLVRTMRGQWSGQTRELADRFLDLGDQVGRRVLVPEGQPEPGLSKIRVHGDYHLGQTLKTDSGFALIDFEGEPTKPIDERRRKQCALKDVSGMIRSFEYAVETARGRAMVPVSAEWSSAPLREAFIETYRACTAETGTRVVPADRAVLDAWIRFFELDKALYEVAYEANNRPGWAHIPLRAVVRLLEEARI